MSNPDYPLADYFNADAVIPGVDDAEDRVEAMRDGGGEVVDEKDADGCESGACKI
ncbi:hypothetical protein pEaSNUABM39_00032 [Erwinia phage pEa_SNUABM_39]|nr:hypothetical protein pEaSNUABM39_00032 [Erwinia phage pEa_SNUABM_39]